MNNVICPHCQHVHLGHTNKFGKVCTHCNKYIAPPEELPIITQNKHAKLLMQQRCREYLTKKFTGGTNADSNR